MLPDGPKVRSLRTRRGWTQLDLATASDTTARTVQRVEKSQHVSIDSLRAIASALELDVAQLQPIDSPPIEQLGPKLDHTAPGMAELLEERRLLDVKIDVLCEYWANRAPGWRAYEGDRRNIEKWMHDFGEPTVVRAMDTCGGNTFSSGPMVRQFRSPRDVGSL